jgi:hypothetical protein
MNVLERD